MYYAKSLGKNRAQAFAENSVVLDGVRMEQELRHALQEGWFEVYYQPKFTAEGELAGLEALIRLNRPERGPGSAGAFIPVAESSGTGCADRGMGAERGLPTGCRLAQARSLTPVVVAVNVSAVQMSRSDFARSVEACLKPLLAYHPTVWSL